jgi:hypothetical protein
MKLASGESMPAAGRNLRWNSRATVHHAAKMPYNSPGINALAKQRMGRICWNLRQ